MNQAFSPAFVAGLFVFWSQQMRGQASGVLDNKRISGYSIADTKAVIRYYNRSCGLPGSPAVGLVDMAKYSEWTKKFGVAIVFQQPTQTRICP